MSYCELMTTHQLLTTTQVASRLGITRQGILMRIKRGTLTPSVTLANGFYLFTETQFEAAAA